MGVKAVAVLVRSTKHPSSSAADGVENVRFRIQVSCSKMVAQE